MLIKRVIVAILLIVSAVFAGLAYERSLLDYNDNGVYFDGITTYDTDAIDAYAGIAFLFFAAGMGIALTGLRSKA